MFSKTDLETILVIFEAAQLSVEAGLDIDDQDNFYAVLNKVRIALKE